MLSVRRATALAKAKKDAEKNFYPRPPRGGRPARLAIIDKERTKFLSTPSARRATAAGSKGGHGHCISIHALREEGDVLGHTVLAALDLFLSTPSARRATGRACCFQPVSNYFYPRPPRGGRLREALFSLSMMDFYPRPPRGGRQVELAQLLVNKAFLSTPSARRATTS